MSRPPAPVAAASSTPARPPPVRRVIRTRVRPRRTTPRPASRTAGVRAHRAGRALAAFRAKAAVASAAGVEGCAGSFLNYRLGVETQPAMFKGERQLLDSLSPRTVRLANRAARWYRHAIEYLPR